MLNLIDIFLKKINYSCIREIILTYQNLEMKSNLNINSRLNKKENILSVLLEVDGRGLTPNNIEAITFSITIEGIFQISEDLKNINDEAMEILSKVKAPQILFPFVIEKIQSLTAQSGIKPVFLPFLDFEKIYFENKQFSEKDKIIN